MLSPVYTSTRNGFLFTNILSVFSSIAVNNILLFVCFYGWKGVWGSRFSASMWSFCTASECCWQEKLTSSCLPLARSKENPTRAPENNFHVRRCAPPKCFTCANVRQKKKAQRASMHASAHVDGMYEPHSEKKVSRYTLFKAVCFYDVASPTKKQTSWATSQPHCNRVRARGDLKVWMQAPKIPVAKKKNRQEWSWKNMNYKKKGAHKSYDTVKKVPTTTANSPAKQPPPRKKTEK